MKRKTYLLAQSRLSPNMLYEDAAQEFIKALEFNPEQHGNKPGRHVGFIEPRTIGDYRNSFKALGKLFAGRRLNSITPNDLRTYQEKRAAGEFTNQERKPPNMGSNIGPISNTINKEVGSLLRVIRAANAWSAEMFESYVPLNPHDPELQRALTPKEQEHFLAIAASKPEWELVYWYSVLALCTTMGTAEMRNLRHRDIDSSQGIVRVAAGAAKNKYRIRTIPLSDEGIKAAEFLQKRARRLGSYLHEHYVFPFRVRKGTYDPTKPGTECLMRSGWEACRAAADVPWLRVYDLRHTAITRLAEAGTPIQVIMDMAGHVSQKMQMHYTHVSMQAKRLAINITSLNQTANARKKKSQDTSILQLHSQQNLSVNNLITALKTAGLPSDQILDIVIAAQNGAPAAQMARAE